MKILAIIILILFQLLIPQTTNAEELICSNVAIDIVPIFDVAHNDYFVQYSWLIYSSSELITVESEYLLNDNVIYSNNKQYLNNTGYIVDARFYDIDSVDAVTEINLFITIDSNQTICNKIVNLETAKLYLIKQTIYLPIIMI